MRLSRFPIGTYDALNRPTNMVDAVGTTHYGYDDAGELLSEGGLWNDDAVSACSGIQKIACEQA